MKTSYRFHQILDTPPLSVTAGCLPFYVQKDGHLRCWAKSVDDACKKIDALSPKVSVRRALRPSQRRKP